MRTLIGAEVLLRAIVWPLIFMSVVACGGGATVQPTAGNEGLKSAARAVARSSGFEFASAAGFSQGRLTAEGRYMAPNSSVLTVTSPNRAGLSNRFESGQGRTYAVMSDGSRRDLQRDLGLFVGTLDVLRLMDLLQKARNISSLGAQHWRFELSADVAHQLVGGVELGAIEEAKGEAWSTDELVLSRVRITISTTSLGVYDASATFSNVRR